MVFGLFKKKEKKPTAEEVSQQKEKIEQEAELERQRKLVSMQKTLEEMKEKIDVGYKRLDDKQAKIKDLIKQKRKAEAKRQLQVLKTYQEELAKQENMCIILEKTKIQIEAARDVNQMTNALREAQDLQKEAEKNRDFLEDYLLDKKEMDDQNKEIGNLLNEIAAGDVEEQEDIDQMYKDLENEVLDDQLDDINNSSLKNVTKNQNTNNYNTYQQQSNPVQTNTQKEDTSINDLLSQAANFN